MVHRATEFAHVPYNSANCIFMIIRCLYPETLTIVMILIQVKIEKPQSLESPMFVKQISHGSTL